MKALKRREFLQLMAGLTGAAVMAACAPAQPTAAPKAEEKPAETPVEKATEAKPAASSSGPYAGYDAKNKDQWARSPRTTRRAP